MSIKSQQASSTLVAGGSSSAMMISMSPSSSLLRWSSPLCVNALTQQHQPPSSLPLISLQQQHQQQTRHFSGLNKKKKSLLTKKKKHELKKKAKLTEAAQKGIAEEDKAVSVQHKEWVEFQQSISVEGFETGQMTEVIEGTGNKNRLARNRKRIYLKLKQSIESQKERQSFLKVGGGTFPTLNYSPEETQRLLAQAHAALPPRAGPRRTKHRKRAERRWWLVRQIHKKYKKHIIKAHERRMVERSRKVRQVKEVLSAAPEIRDEDRDYQLESFKRWSAAMTQNSKGGTGLIGDGSSGEGKQKQIM
eukprot:CAMPEP_0198138682 /NCGR_PEP_ID=MMETSP1443-20131203/2078_1 /TAXON_ID=186043 /ORGANISM="Entomoneis sp., Strain CCMP2396" /LENGTH=304 /DNA_ID=CAMNT_0043800567 /DNA_START=182 /DNA_END=1096 /DNA_ORIENTATION=+